MKPEILSWNDKSRATQTAPAASLARLFMVVAMLTVGAMTASAIAPKMTLPTTLTVLENLTTSAVTNITIGVSDADTNVNISSVALTATSSNTNLVANSGLVISGSGASQTLTITPAQYQFGSATITVVATDSQPVSTTNTFILHVTLVEQPPSFDLSTNEVAVSEETGAVSIPNFLTGISTGPSSQSTQTFKFVTTTASGDPTNAVFIKAPVVSTNGTLTFTPKIHSYGTNLVTLVMDNNASTANGGVNSFTTNFLIAVVQTNHVPNIIKVNNVSVKENTSNTVTLSVSVWDYDQNSSNFVLTATSSNTNLETATVSTNVSLPSATNAVFTLTLTLTTNEYGVVTNQLVATEDGLSTTNTFKLTVTHVNQAPSFSFNTNVVISNMFSSGEEEGVVTNAGFLTNMSAGPSDESAQTWKFIVTTAAKAATNAAFTVAPAIDTNGTLTFHSKTHSYGTNLVTVVMRDNGGTAEGGTNSFTNTFLLAIVQTNHAPTIVKVPNQAMLENATNVTLSVTVWNYDQDSTNFTLTATSGNTNLATISVSTNVSTPTPTNAVFSVTMTLVSNQFGILTNQLVASVGGLSTTNTFKLTVTHVNQAPSFTFNTNVVISNVFSSEEEILSVTNVGFLTNLSAGPANESNQNWRFIVSTQAKESTNALFTVLPAIATNGTLTFKPKIHSYGSNWVTVVMLDNGGTAHGGIDAYTNTFLLAIVQTNHAPAFFTVTNQSVYENASNFTASVDVWDYDQHSSNCTLTVTSSNTNLETAAVSTNVSHPSLTNAIFTVTMTLVSNQFGVVTNMLVATEDGLSTTNTFVVTVNHVNQPPTFTFNTNVVVSNMFSSEEETLSVTNIGFLTNLTAGPTNENTQTWAFTVTTASGQATNASFTTVPAIATNGTLTYSPKAHSYGTNLVTIVMTDNGGTAHGGVATLTNTFLLAIVQTNHAPVIVASNITVLENATNFTVPVTVWDYDKLNSNFVLTATSPFTNVETVSVGTNAVLSNQTNAVFTLTFTLRTNQFWTVTNQLIATEGALSTTNTLVVTITHVNQAPSFTFNTNVVITNVFSSEEETLAVTNVGFLTNLSAGPTNESAQTWAFTVTTVTNQATNALFTKAPAIDTNGTLTFNPQAHSYGTNLVTVVMTDNGGTANGGVNAFTNTFFLAIVQTNHAPVIIASNITVLENATNFTVPVTVWDYDKLNSNFVLTATSPFTNLETVSVGTNAVLSNQTNAVFTLTFALGTNQFGVITNQLIATEGALSTTNTLVVTITHVNQPPTFTFDTNQVVSNVLVIAENTGLTSLPNFLTNLAAGPTNQITNTWGFTVTTATNTGSTNATFTQLSAATNGTLTLNATTNSFGTNIVTVVMTNNGGTANGGINAYTNTFQLQVYQILYAPEFTGISNKTILENATTNLTLAFSLYNHLNTNFNVTAVSSDTNVVTVSVGGAGALPILTFTPVTNQNGTNTITVTAVSGSLTNSTNLTLTVTPVNQPPSFSLAIPSVTVDQYDVAVTLSNTLTNISAGPSNESSQTVTFTVTNSNSNLFGNGASPAIDTNGTLTFTPAHQGGTVTVGIKAVDDGGTANGGVDTSPVQTMTIIIPTNTFQSVTGTYAGLYYNTNTVDNASSGYFNLVLATNGTFTGYLTGAGNSNTFSGQFDISNYYASVTASGSTLDLTIDTGTNQAVSGSVTNSGGAWDASLQGYRAGFSASSHTSLAGVYLAAMAGFDDPTVGPPGDSIFSLTLSSVGAVTLSGTMADNTAAAQVSQLSLAGYYPLYVPLYSGGSDGALIGWLQFNGNAGSSLTTNSTLTWLSAAGASAFYGSGFTNQTAPTASEYNSSLANVLGFTSGNVILSGGNLQASLTNAVTVSGNVITVTPATNGLNLTITTSTGEIQGSFIDPDSALTNTFHAAILQGTNYAPGFFLGTNQGGAFILIGN